MLDIEKVDNRLLDRARRNYHDVEMERVIAFTKVTSQIDAARYGADAIAREMLEPMMMMGQREHNAMEDLRNRVLSDQVMPTALMSEQSFRSIGAAGRGAGCDRREN